MGVVTKVTQRVIYETSDGVQYKTHEEAERNQERIDLGEVLLGDLSVLDEKRVSAGIASSVYDVSTHLVRFRRDLALRILAMAQEGLK